MKRILYLSLAAVMAIVAVSCKKDNGNSNLPKYGEGNLWAPMPEAVDLGLSVKWASTNLFATNEYQFGLFFAWGELTYKSEYTLENYKYPAPTNVPTTLPSSRDAAEEWLGEGWRIPTKDEIQELVDTFNDDDYTWKADTKKADDGTTVLLGWRITSNAGKTKGNSIYLPTAGLFSTVQGFDGNSGFYWSSTIYDVWPYNAWAIAFTETGPSVSHDTGRYLGLPIRAVYED